MNCSVSLRPLSLSDTSSVVRWRNQPFVYKNLFTQVLISEEQHISYYHKYVETGKVKQFIITAEIEGRTIDIGTIFLRNFDRLLRTAEFGIFIGESSAIGKGCSFQATVALLQIAFNDYDLESVYLEVFSDNIPAYKTYCKAGFTVMEEYSRIDGRKVYRMSLNRNQFQTSWED